MFWLDSVPRLMLTHDSETVNRLRRIVWRRGLRVSGATWTGTWRVCRGCKTWFTNGKKGLYRRTQNTGESLVNWASRQRALKMADNTMIRKHERRATVCEWWWWRGSAGFATAGRAKGLHDARNGLAQRFATGGETFVK